MKNQEGPGIVILYAEAFYEGAKNITSGNKQNRERGEVEGGWGMGKDPTSYFDYFGTDY